MFFFYQRSGGEEQWHSALSEHRQKVIAEIHPAFVTVLDVDALPEDGWSREEYGKLKYKGPFYADFDGETLDDTLPNFKLFLAKLKEQGVELEALRLYATGGRGFHIEVPDEILMPKVPRGGITLLPSIYKEVAFELIVETLDMRVYSARKGRMWRTAGVQRDNKAFKVPLTLDEALNITVDNYKELCSQPRPEPQRGKPRLALGMAAMFAKAQAKMTEAVKRTTKTAAQDTALLAKFKGNFPPTVGKVMRGEGLLHGIGFQKIAMQLAITANALGKTADELVAACEDLVKGHQSDSQRYNSPRKRKEELRRMWDYTHENPAYSFSAGGIKSLLEPDQYATDLDLVDRSKDGYVWDGETDEQLTEEEAAEIALADRGQAAGLVVRKTGTYVRTNDGLKALSHVALIKPMRLISSEDSLHIGFECDVFLRGKRHSKAMLPVDAFKSRAAIHGAFSAYGGTFLGNDIQAGALMTILDHSAKEAKRDVFVVHREGLDLVQSPLHQDEVKLDTVWAAPSGVWGGSDEVIYRYQPKLVTSPVYHTDIHLCRPLEDSADVRAWLSALMRMNSDITVAQMLGWFVSCLHKQYYQRAFNQFPLLHPNGAAGTGKTATTSLLGRLFHNTTRPQVMSCSSSASTPFMLKGAWTNSASIPLILDEYKPSELGPVRTDLLLQLFRISYNQGLGGSGGVSRGNGNGSYRDVTQYAYSAPVAFMGESQEMQTAIVQRSLPVAFTPSGKDAHSPEFAIAEAGADYLPQLGNALLKMAMQETVDTRRAAVQPYMEQLRSTLDKHVHIRQVYNLSVVLAGLDFLDGTLRAIFGDAFRGDIDRLKDAVFTNKSDVAVQAVNETAKVLNDLSLMSRTEEPGSEFAIREGYEYVIGDGYIEILLRESFVKYFAWCKRKGFSPLFSSVEAFTGALGKFDPVIDKLCLGSPLKRTGQSRVYRFNPDRLAAEGVEMFKSKAHD